MQGQRGIHVLCVVAEPGAQLARHVANRAQVALLAFDSTFAHHGQYHLVLLAMAVTRGKARGLHPAVFLVEVVLGVGNQLIPQRAQLLVASRFDLRQQGDELFMHLVHDGKIEDESGIPFEAGHGSSLCVVVGFEDSAA